MKIGVRKPNIKKSIKARTTGKVKRKINKTVNPLYGKKGMGYINNPTKAVYNKVYNKTSISGFNLFKKSNNIFYKMIMFPIILVYYGYKYMFLGIVWVIKQIINLIKNKEKDI